MESSKNKNGSKLVTSVKSVHVVYLSCPNCGEEEEHVVFCSNCSQPMKVINVVEKFGEEAEEFMKKLNLKKKLESDEVDSMDDDIDETPNVIILSDDEHIDADGSIEDGGEVDLGVIFPSDNEEESPAGTPDPDLTEALEQLDEEDEGLPEDLDFGDDGLPAL